jgi:hypothetical protein
VYFVSGGSLNSSRRTEFGASGHFRISTSDVSKIAADRPLSKMRQCANDPQLAQFIVSIGVRERVERSVIERKPTHDVRKLRRRKRDLVAPSWMGSELPLVKAAHLNPIAKLRGHHFAEFPGGIATGRIEIDMRMLARDTRRIEIRHRRSFGSRANPFRQSGFDSGSAPAIVSSSMIGHEELVARHPFMPPRLSCPTFAAFARISDAPGIPPRSSGAPSARSRRADRDEPRDAGAPRQLRATTHSGVLVA